MSVYGSLYSAVSGIQAQGVAIGIISDNISNVNTAGYKAATQQFGTLVTGSSSGSSYSPGGVRANSRQLISQQGLIQTTSSTLDIAIQGNGQFVVSDNPDGESGGGGILYSRAGNFSPDSQGNFRNAAGYYLQAWPLDSNGDIPANSTSTTTLETVNIGEAFGDASATTQVTYSGNLDSRTETLPGSGQIGLPGSDATNVQNQGASGSSILIPNGNMGINIPSQAGSASAAAADAAIATASPSATADGTAQFGNGLAAVADAARDAAIADANVIAIAGAVASVTAAADAARDAAILNGDTEADTLTAVVAAIEGAITQAANDNADYDGDTLRVTTGSNLSDDFVYGGFTESNDIAGGILGATTPTQSFSAATTGDEFSIIIDQDTSNALTFTYSASPTAGSGQFNSLQTLAAEINAVDGLTARVAEASTGVFRLYVSSEDARQQLQFVDNPVSGGSNISAALGLQDVPASTANRWNTLEGLAALANTRTSGRLTAEVLNSSSSNATINIFNSDPLTTIQFENLDSDTDAVANGDFLTELGITSDVLNPAYDASPGSGSLSMASGNITPDFERTFGVFDALGEEHLVTVGFVKVGTGEWRAELYANDAADINTSVVPADENDRFIAEATVTFDGSGNLALLDPDWSTNPPEISWTSGAGNSTIAIDLGTIGTKSGLAQSSGLDSSSVTQNGAAVGLLDTVSIDEEGFVIANFTNGQSRQLYKIPIATFSNYDGLQSRNGNVFIATLESGDVNLAEAGNGGAGVITPEALETSNSELSEELTDMIIAQRSYQANSKVITVADELLEELNRI